MKTLLNIFAFLSICNLGFTQIKKNNYTPIKTKTNVSKTTVKVDKTPINAKNISYSKNLINNGIPWYDDKNNTINAHGGCIVEDKGKYYFFGEYKTDDINKFIGFSCYSSTNLVNWKFERLVLAPQKQGILGPNRIGERVKVMRCPSTGEYVMYMHCDDLKYNDPYIGYAISKTIAGDYEFKGALLYEDAPINRWDMGTFQDSDGKGYLLIHHGTNYRLSNDYKSAETIVGNHIPESGESPAMFKKNGIYYLLYSNLTSWERNDNYYYTASSVEGPWRKRGIFCPQGSLTYNSQCSFVFPLVRNNDTIPMYMGDRWSFPRQASAATYVWLPLQTEGTKLSIPEYMESWNPLSENITTTKTQINKIETGKNHFNSNKKGDFKVFPFSGSSISLFGETSPHGGYALITISDKKGKNLFSTQIDFYSKIPSSGIRFKSPQFRSGSYIMKIEVIGDHGVWYKKNGDKFGSDDNFVNVSTISVKK